jgi:hypothetical protein
MVRNNCNHLSAKHQKKLLQLLMKYESLFDGILGDWKTKPVYFQSSKMQHHTAGELYQYQKYTKMSSSKKLRDCINWEY